MWHFCVFVHVNNHDREASDQPLNKSLCKSGVCPWQPSILCFHQRSIDGERDSVRWRWPAWTSSFSRNSRRPRSAAEGKHHGGPRASEKGAKSASQTTTHSAYSYSQQGPAIWTRFYSDRMVHECCLREGRIHSGPPECAGPKGGIGRRWWDGGAKQI